MEVSGDYLLNKLILFRPMQCSAVHFGMHISFEMAPGLSHTLTEYFAGVELCGPAPSHIWLRSISR